jgi:hypothetical protein
MARLAGKSSYKLGSIHGHFQVMQPNGASFEIKVYNWLAPGIADASLGFGWFQGAAVGLSSKCEAARFTKGTNSHAMSGKNVKESEQDSDAQLPVQNGGEQARIQSVKRASQLDITSCSILPPESLLMSWISRHLAFRSLLHLPNRNIVGPLIDKVTTTNPSSFISSTRLLSTFSLSHLHPRRTSPKPSASQNPLLNSHRHYHSKHTPIKTSDEATATRPGQHRSPVIDKLWRIRNAVEPTNPAADYAKPPQKELITKKPSDSMLAMEYPLSKDLELREKYRNPWDSMRIGRLLEDLDASEWARFLVPRWSSSSQSNFSHLWSGRMGLTVRFM